MTNSLDLRRLRYFRTIAEQGSFAGAARALNVAQPALSHHMAELERLLDVQLLLRSRRGARLTQAGEALLRHARAILEQAAHAELGMKGFHPDGSRRAIRAIHIAVMPSLASSLTPLLFSAVNRDLPGLALHLIEAVTRESHAMVESGAVDLAVNLNTDRQANIEPLSWEDMVFVSPARAALPGATTITFAELARERLVLPSPGKPIRVLVDQVASRLDLGLDIVLEIDGLNPSIRAIIEGLGSSVMAPLNIADEHAAGLVTVRRIIEPPITRQVVLERRKGFDPTLASRLRDLLKEQLQVLMLRHGQYHNRL